MSFFDDASLVFLPSGQAGKDGKAYSMKPTNGDGDFTFSRGSNLTATRVDSNGLIEKGRENLLLQSNQFDTTWSATNASVTSGQSGYDGSSDAWLLTATNTAANLIQSVSSSGVNTYSIYAKAGTENGIFLRADGGDNPRLFFKLDTGTIGSTSGTIIDSSIESVGNGWYRVSLVVNVSITQVRIYVADNSNGFPSSGSIYIQDAQLEIGLTSTEYIESGATTGLAGILEDSPRFDYSGGASCPSLLLEPSRTNLVTQSEYFGDTTWVNNYTLTPNYTTSPDGSKNAYRVQVGTANGYLREQISVSSSTDYVFSFYAKRGSATEMKYRVYDFTNGGDIANNSYYSQTSSSNWVRIEVPFTTAATTASVGVYIDSDGQGNGDFYVFGAQLEQGSYPTSYIPNHSGGSVTREADSCNTSYVTTQSSMTYYVEFKVDSVDEEQQVFHLYNSADQYGLGVTIDHNNSNSGVIGIRGRNQRTTTDFGVTSFSGLTANTNYKLAFVVDWSNETITNARLNGNTSDGVISARVTTINGLYLGSRADNYFISGNIAQFLVFPSALSVPEIITLTS